MSLIDHNHQYKIYADNFFANAATVSGVSYSKRHFEMVKTSDKATAAKHIALGIFELLPVIGAIIAIFERIIVSALHAKIAVVPQPPIPVVDKDEMINDLNDRVTDLTEELNQAEEALKVVTAERDADRKELLRVNKLYRKIQGEVSDLKEQVEDLENHVKESSPSMTDSMFERYKIDVIYPKRMQRPSEEKFVPPSEGSDSDNENGVPSSPDIQNEDLFASFVEIEGEKVEDLDALMTYQDVGNGNPKIGLNEVLSEENWNELLDANDFSYAIAKTHTVEEEKQSRVDQHFNKVADKLHDQGWGDFCILFGKTGKFNIDDDAACVIMVNREKNLVYVAFHGSRNGSKINMWNPEGDWGANYDSTLVSAKEEGLYGAPEGVMFHRGFGMNFISVQDNLLERLGHVIPTLEANPHIIITGHSKGGGEANIAVPAVSQYLKDNGIKAKVGAVTLSAPMAFNKAGSKWVHEVVNIRNILRIKVKGDPVTYGSLIGKDYAHVGIRLRDNIADVNRRTAEWHGDEGQVRKIEGWANFHYGAYRDGSYCFVPEIVMRQPELMAAFDEWVESQHIVGHTHLAIEGFVPPNSNNDVEDME